jgi:hypothetical protein
MAEFNILQASDVIVPIVFTGANAIGPQIVMTLPQVLITPNKAIGLISDNLTTMELDGEVLIDLTTGSAGTVVTPDGQTSPAIANYYDGKGIVTINGRDCGNVSKFELHVQVKRVDHFSSRFGTKVKDFTFVQEKEAKVTLTLDEFTFDNLLLVLLGSAV